MSELQAAQMTKPRRLSPRLVRCLYYTGWTGVYTPRESARLTRVLSDWGLTKFFGAFETLERRSYRSLEGAARKCWMRLTSSLRGSQDKRRSTSDPHANVYVDAASEQRQLWTSRRQPLTTSKSGWLTISASGSLNAIKGKSSILSLSGESRGTRKSSAPS